MGSTKGNVFGGPLYTLKVIFVDLLLACCRLASELNQGFVLLKEKETEIFGIATFCIIWIPGFTFAIHILSQNRKEWVWYHTILAAFLCILLYPLTPIIAIFKFLWSKPKNSKRRSVNPKTPEKSENPPKTFNQEFQEAKYGATITQAIHGSIASPIQLCYQLWLAMNGVISFHSNAIHVSSLNLTDWEGNELIIPIAAPICIFLLTLGYVFKISLS